MGRPVQNTTQPPPRPSRNSDPSLATPKLIAAPQLNPRHYVNLWPRTSLCHLPATCPFILERAMSATHIAVILRTRTGPAYEEESMQMDYPDVRNEYGMS
ncbi:hypothetical protein SCLCIDRAFT_25864 [Scleroderma citrinum Foug A]|uniref:Uncharacterized protein n=1 Tax=Scleroderma citrinum Foug A TaxID=1036808 RepID=A0A0C3A912_9AGAM|nr:hypothetical protein SCLCIDRAFT_25864 [Scleroderma citrinum Foug A]